MEPFVVLPRYLLDITGNNTFIPGKSTTQTTTLVPLLRT